MVHERATGLGSTIKVNDNDVAEYGAIVESYKVGGTSVSNDVFQGRNRTHFNVLSSVFGRRSIEVNLFFKAETRRELTLNKSALDGEMFGEVELFLPDGFYYTAVLKKAAGSEILGVDENEVIALCTYEFEGIQHDPLVSVTGNDVMCTSTMPHTDCRLICTASEAYEELEVGSVIITNVAEGDVIVVDGINGQILQNGAPCAGNMHFMHFPSLAPGMNSLTCVETLTVEYYPTYI